MRLRASIRGVIFLLGILAIVTALPITGFSEVPHQINLQRQLTDEFSETLRDDDFLGITGGTVGGLLTLEGITGPQLVLHDSGSIAERPGIQFTGNYIHFIAGDDLSDEYFGFYSGYSSSRSYDAKLRVFGKASGNYASICGGRGNTASGIESSVSGGVGNTAEFTQSSVSGGNNNTSSGTASSVSGGQSNTASGQESSVTGGKSDQASDLCASVSGGANNTAGNDYASQPTRALPA